MSAWLNRQRKIDLVNMASEAGLVGLGSLRKDEIAAALAEHLDTHPRLASSANFSGYFNHSASSPLKRGSSPVKREPRSSSIALPDVDAAARPARATRARRATRGSDEIDAHTTSASRPTAALSSPPREAQDHEHQITTTTTQRIKSSALLTSFPSLLPPSPAAVTDLLERQTAHLSATASAFWSSHFDLPTTPLHNLRAALSTPVGLQAVLLLLEAYGLQSRTLPWRYAFTVPLPSGIPFLVQNAVNNDAATPASTSGLNVKVPDFFALLDARAFWGPTLLWTFTSLLLPMLAGWLFNISLASAAAAANNNNNSRGGRSSSSSSSSRSPGSSRMAKYTVDPLAFNVAKGLLAWLVYEKGAALGGVVGRASALTVRESLPGGVWGLCVGTAIGGLGAVYEAVLAAGAS